MATVATMADLKAYVTGKDGGGLCQAESTVMLHVTHSNLKAKFVELRFDLHMTIEAVKVKLSFHSGTNPSSMVLTLLDESGATVATLWDDARKLGFYSPRNGYMLHITDADPTSASAGGWLEDTSLVQKYVISDEDYNKRENTYRRWKDQKLKDDPAWTLEREIAARKGLELPPPKVTDPEHLKAEAEAIQVGSRCSVDPGDRRGEVMFVGQVEGLTAGYWVGVRFDEPLGKNDGTVKGKRYFECPVGFGAFVRPDKVHTGNFPPIDEFESDGLSDGDEI